MAGVAVAALPVLAIVGAAIDSPNLVIALLLQAIACVLPLAVLSWRLVERPAMRVSLPSRPTRPTGDLHVADQPRRHVERAEVRLPLSAPR